MPDGTDNDIEDGDEGDNIRGPTNGRSDSIDYSRMKQIAALQKVYRSADFDSSDDLNSRCLWYYVPEDYDDKEDAKFIQVSVFDRVYFIFNP